MYCSIYVVTVLSVIFKMSNVLMFYVIFTFVVRQKFKTVFVMFCSVFYFARVMCTEEKNVAAFELEEQWER